MKVYRERILTVNPMPLGEGLGALIRKKKPHGKSERVRDTGAPRAGVFFVDVNNIDAGAQQARKDFVKSGIAELAASIRQHGILQPLVVEKREEEGGRGIRVRYHLLAGERRLRAAKLAGLTQVPVVIRHAQDDRTRLLLSLIENVQREDLNAMERAEAFSRLRDEFRLSQEEIAQRIGKSREAVANTLRLLQLPDEMRDAVRRGALSEGHARAVLGVSAGKRTLMFHRLRERPMNVREAEALARELGGVPRRQAPVRVADARRAADEEKLRTIFGVPVRITTRGERGSLAFVFRSKAELRELFRRLLGKQ